jgi:hypothetical protein
MLARHTGQAPPRDLTVFLLKLDGDVISPQESGGYQAAARSPRTAASAPFDSGTDVRMLVAC